jgi:very-short-patch-repair endonuclease
MRAQDRTADQQLARLASASHGVVTRMELQRAGVTKAEIERRVRSGALLREHRGVYRVGHRAPSLEARYLAAVRACGDGAVLSGRAAAHLYGLLRGAAPTPEVTAPTERRVPGVLTRRSRSPLDATTWRSVPVTTVARTLVDLAGVLDASELARVCHEAGIRHGTNPGQVGEVLARRPASPGARKLRAVLSGDERVTLSRLERGFLKVLRRAGLPLPETNIPADGRYVDCRWPEHRLTIELDGYRFHNSRYSWERDRRREREARARGDDFRRFTWDDVENPRLMLRELRVVLTSARRTSRTQDDPIGSRR